LDRIAKFIKLAVGSSKPDHFAGSQKIVTIPNWLEINNSIIMINPGGDERGGVKLHPYCSSVLMLTFYMG